MKNAVMLVFGLLLALPLYGANNQALTMQKVTSSKSTGSSQINNMSSTTAATSGIVTDIDGNVYRTITIGTQVWMAENLKVTHYRNGDPISKVTGNADWGGLSTGAYCEYNNDINNVATYGRLYNWYAVADNRNIAPTGWHVASDADWKQLEMYLGLSQAEADGIGYRGTNQGGKLKNFGDGATNDCGFSALPGGYRQNAGDYQNLNSSAGFWTSSEYSSSYSWYRTLYYAEARVDRSYYLKSYGFSVRCVLNSGNTTSLIHKYTDIVQVLSDSESVLISGKPTAIRATYRPNDPNAQFSVNAKLFISKGTSLPDSFASDPPRVTIKSYYTPEEITRAENTINFYPGTLEAGNYSVYVDINGSHSPVKQFSIPSAAYMKDEIYHSGNGGPKKKFKILFQPIEVTGKGSLDNSRFKFYNRSAAYMQSVYPLPDNAVSWYEWPSRLVFTSPIDRTGESGQIVMAKLKKRLDLNNSVFPPTSDMRADMIVGITTVSGLMDNGIAGQIAGFSYYVDCGNVVPLAERAVVLSDLSVTALTHETGHLLGLGEEYNKTGRNITVCDPPNPRYCDCKKGDNIGNYVDAGGFNASLKSQRATVPGLCYISPTWWGSTLGDICSLAENRAHSYMGMIGTYFMQGVLCFASEEEERWTTSDCYGYLNGKFRNWSTQQQVAKIDVPGVYMEVEGVIHSNNSVDVLPIRKVSGYYDQPAGSSDYSIGLVDSLGNALSSFVLDASFKTTDSEPLDFAGFVAYIPYDSLARSVRITRSGQAIKTITSTLSKPSITLLSPNGGESITGLYNITWDSNDSDGDSLFTDVLYLNGLSGWQLIAENIVGNSLDVDFSQLPGGNNCLIKVIVSDRFNSSVDSSDNYFEVANAAPLVTIVNPKDSTVLLQHQTLVLEGSYYDPEGDLIDSTQQVWRSDIGGMIGSGPKIETSVLAPGRHLITLSAMDLLGATGIDTVIVTVYADNDLDGMPDNWEVQVGLNTSFDDAEFDPDNDGLSNRQEWLAGTDPHDSDSDDDGYLDGIEVGYHSNPNDAASAPTLISSVQLLLPSNSSTISTDTVDFSWNPSTHPDPSIVINYYHEISTDSTFTQALTSAMLGSTSYSISGSLVLGSTYYWRVMATTPFGSVVYSSQTFRFRFKCCIQAGDANNDTKCNVGDAVFLINYVFKEGPSPSCIQEGDANADGKVNVGDAVYLINYVFKSGPAPKCP